MTKNNALIGEAYYIAMGEKNVAGMEKHLHPDVKFFGPLATATGKQAVLDGNSRFMTFFNSLKVRAKFGSSDQAMIVYDLEFPAPIGTLSSSSLMSFEDGLIIRIELFYDARPFDPRFHETKKEEALRK